MGDYFVFCEGGYIFFNLGFGKLFNEKFSVGLITNTNTCVILH